MWMGTYPSVPSYVIGTDETLEDYLNKNPNLVGKNIVDKFGGGLPFLPKVGYLPLESGLALILTRRIDIVDGQGSSSSNPSGSQTCRKTP